MNLIAVGPWYVVAPLAQCFASDGTQTHLSLRGGTAVWVGGGEKWKAWSGPEREAREYAALHGGEAAPAKLVDARHIRLDWREDPRHHSTHAHDRTGEEVA